MGFEGSMLWRVRQKVGADPILWPGASVMVVRDDGRALMGRRLDNDMWAIPGGGAEQGSSFAETVVTELVEEVGLVADPATSRATGASAARTTISRSTRTATSPTTSASGSPCGGGAESR